MKKIISLILFSLFFLSSSILIPQKTLSLSIDKGLIQSQFKKASLKRQELEFDQVVIRKKEMTQEQIRIIQQQKEQQVFLDKQQRENEEEQKRFQQQQMLYAKEQLKKQKINKDNNKYYQAVYSNRENTNMTNIDKIQTSIAQNKKVYTHEDESGRVHKQIERAFQLLEQMGQHLSTSESIDQFNYKLEHLREALECHQQEMKQNIEENQKVQLAVMSDILVARKRIKELDNLDTELIKINEQVVGLDRTGQQMALLDKSVILLQQSQEDKQHDLGKFSQQYVHLNSQAYRVSRIINIKQTDTAIQSLLKMRNAQLYHYSQSLQYDHDQEINDYRQIEQQQNTGIGHLYKLFKDQNRNEESTLEEMKEIESLDQDYQIQEKSVREEQDGLVGELIGEMREGDRGEEREEVVKEDKLQDEEDSYVQDNHIQVLIDTPVLLIDTPVLLIDTPILPSILINHNLNTTSLINNTSSNNITHLNLITNINNLNPPIINNTTILIQQKDQPQQDNKDNIAVKEQDNKSVTVGKEQESELTQQENIDKELDQEYGDDLDNNKQSQA